ncbi:MAG: holo-ACP synthase [Candidatus Aureabacteria bacterium]|nr:holo-ACP synthase [Candidatus Auribacterota bacterium]
MIAGIGIDIIDVQRMRNIVEKETGARFLDRTFSEREKEYCSTFKDPLPRFAGRFAAKEAFVKASSSFLKGIALKDIETLNASSGAPGIAVLKGDFDSSRYACHVSISHTETYACACVVIEVKEGVAHDKCK